MEDAEKTVAVLFTRKDSVYFGIPEADVYDIDRDALTFSGGLPIVAHPPCRAWGSLRYQARPRPGERDLALWAVDRIRECGGVLEHPERSQLWPEKGLPEPGETDQWGGYTIAAPQWWWGHPANKATRFYVCGVPVCELPEIPLRLGEAEYVVTFSHGCRRRPEMPRWWREATPPALARWLVETAKRCVGKEVCA